MRVSGGIVDVGDDRRIGDCDIDGLRDVAMDDVARLCVSRQSQQLVDERARDADRMAVFAGVGGHRDRSAMGAKPGGQRFDGRDLDVRVIHRQEHRGVRGVRNQSQAALQRAEHAAIRIGILGEQNIVPALDARANLIRVPPDHNHNRIADRRT